ncbi:hypothetical protein M231_01091 [Tremella mesenterica]|uniref:Uncharacterized protein n=1 Tax=Tremella mesenterica TaxID=5217 RepID=A0A4Q1BUD7_TREME|nr:hypothetical protein M231_01091 [Tremella mesenterica]
MYPPQQQETEAVQPTATKMMNITPVQTEPAKEEKASWWPLRLRGGLGPCCACLDGINLPDHAVYVAVLSKRFVAADLRSCCQFGTKFKESVLDRENAHPESKGITLLYRTINYAVWWLTDDAILYLQLSSTDLITVSLQV